MRNQRRSWYRIENAASDESDIYIYDQIAWFAIGASQFVKDLGKVTAKKLNVRINSPGGNVFEGMTIHNALKRHPATVHTHIDGLAASISSVIALSGDVVHMADNGFYMIHEPSVALMGNADDLRKTANTLDKVGEAIGNIYRKKTGKDADEIASLMKDETWFSAQEAKDAGFVDEIVDGVDVTAAFDLSAFRNAPRDLVAMARDISDIETIRDFEEFLRDAGFSNAAAKAIAAGGFKARTEPRDEAGDLSEIIAALNRRGEALHSK